MTLRLLAAVLCVGGMLSVSAACESFGEGQAGAPGAPAGPTSDASADATTTTTDATDASFDPCGDRTAAPSFAARFDTTDEPWQFEQLVRISTGVEDFGVVTTGGLNGNALRVSARQGPGTSHNAWLRRGFVPQQTTRRVRLDFDFIIEAAGHDYAVLAGLFFESSGTVKDFGIVMQDRGSAIDESYTGDSPNTEPSFKQNVVGAPHHATVCILHVPGATDIRRIARIDETVVDDRANLPLGTVTRFEVRIGVFYTSWQDVETRVLYDDVEVRID